jgi:hypothetical protein
MEPNYPHRLTHDRGPDPGEAMQLAKDARASALVLLESTKEITDLNLKDQALHHAQMSLTLAILEDAIALWVDQVERETAPH